VANVNGFDYTEMLHEFGQVVSVRVQVVAMRGLRRTAVSAPIVRDAAESVVGQEHHLVFEGIGAERPAMAEDDGLTGTPVLEVELVAVVNGECGHERPPRCVLYGVIGAG
jgi:hypothetical protein